MKTINLICTYCGKHFDKNLSEYKNKVKNRHQSNFYCSTECGYNYKIDTSKIDKDILVKLINKGLNYNEISEKLNKGRRIVSHWANEYGLKTKYRTSLQGTERTCTICGREYIYFKHDGHTLNRCNTCGNRIQRDKRKHKLIDCKGGKCLICGYDKCLGALEFHHIDPSKKEFNLSVNYFAYPWHIIKQEIDKCILVCANCHREIHGGLIDLNTYAT